jgi:hypothetical protein
MGEVCAGCDTDALSSQVSSMMVESTAEEEEEEAEIARVSWLLKTEISPERGWTRPSCSRLGTSLDLFDGTAKTSFCLDRRITVGRIDELLLGRDATMMAGRVAAEEELVDPSDGNTTIKAKASLRGAVGRCDRLGRARSVYRL